jgi:hypothetical protein
MISGPMPAASPIVTSKRRGLLSAASCGIVDVDEAVLEAELRGHPWLATAGAP